MSNLKMFVIVRDDLSPSQKAVQAAQLVEQLTLIQKVKGSSPLGRSKYAGLA
jgi:hypothetical protein